MKLHKKPKGVFLFVDDDKNEHLLLKVAMKELELDNQVICCYNGAEALAFLRESQHDFFAIISDIDMPKMDGLELKRIIDQTPELKSKCIPFFYHSNRIKLTEVRTAYTLNIQGFIRKSIEIDGTIESLRKIVELWTDCIHPRDFVS